MIHSVRFTAVLDTNVLYPVIIRDILFWFAYYDMFTPAWSKHIFKEWEEVIRRKDPNMADEDIFKQVTKANLAFPFAEVKNYEALIKQLTLKDPDDCHVLAAAIKINANIIVTQNLQDFPEGYLSTFNIGVKHPDDFICDIIDLNPRVAIEAFKAMVLNKANPDLDEYQVLDMLRNNGLKQSADYLHSQI